MPKKDRWVPLQSASLTGFNKRADLALLRAGMTQEELDYEAAHSTYWVNDLYQVSRTVLDPPDGHWVQLNIRRRDGRPILRDWRHFQRIKNELVGEECEAVELYPAEGRKVDMSNKYHLWCCTDPTFRFPLGFTHGLVQNQVPGSTSPGLKQRKLA